MDPVAHDAASNNSDDGVWPMMSAIVRLGSVRDDIHTLKQITYQLRIQTSRLNGHVMRLRRGSPDATLSMKVIRLNAEVLAAHREDLESAVLHRIPLIETRDHIAQLISTVSFHFEEPEGLFTCINYWGNRVKAINLALKIAEIVEMDESLGVDRDKLKEEKLRFFRKLMMSWDQASTLGGFATLGVARGLMGFWQDLSGDTFDLGEATAAIKTSILQRVVHPFHTWFPSDGSQQQINEAADMLVGGVLQHGSATRLTSSVDVLTSCKNARAL
jgi:hypothetical protein